MRAAIALALAVVTSSAGAVAATKSAHFQVGAQVVSSARIVSFRTPSGFGTEARSFGGEAHALLVEQRSGEALSLKGSTVAIPREGGAPLLVRSAGELAFESGGPAEVVVTLLADGLPPSLQKLNVTVIRSK